MTVRAELVSAARELLIAASGAPGAKVIAAKSGDAPRPQKPYVTVRYTTIGQGQGPAWGLRGLTPNEGDPDDLALALPNVKMRERREAVLSFQGYGPGSADWLDALQIGIDSPDSLTKQRELGIAARMQTGLREISALLDTAEEQRFMLELRFGYLHDSAVADQVPAETVEVETELRRSDDDADTLSADQIVQLS